MPLISDRRFDYQKIYRPNGTKYAEAHGSDLHATIDLAMNLWLQEFGPLHQALAVIEIVGVTAEWSVTVMEIPEEP